ncbi:MAG: rhodanese-like domain-containing protein [Faecalibacterium sp.]|uniref:rhodanese-like domain-containing protein n=1 Tax=Faecalibacterium sp. TaxID=1971605 RepID=UPI002EA3CEBD|nr:rhodanese-like domain-containing protein [Faecalibacterium sp.]
MVEKITPAEAIRLLDAGKAQAVDVREPDEFAVGHIPGAKLLPLGDVLTRAEEVMPDKNAQWLIYCRTGRRSADAAQKLETQGYTGLRDLGGILSWPYEIEGDFEGHF